MDSVTQITLGAAVGVAVMGKRVPLWQSALWGGVAGTTPDLDVFINFGDATLNMVRHRAETHSIFYLTLITPLFAAAATLLHKQQALFKRWFFAFWLVFMTHIGLDYLTIYGTQLLMPFSDYPFERGSIFIIDPFYTVPLLVGVVASVVSTSPKRLRFNTIGLALSSLYLVWGIGVQQHVQAVAKASLPDQLGSEVNMLVTPSALNSILWRVLVTTPTHYYEGWYSLWDGLDQVTWQQHDRGPALIAQYGDLPSAERIRRFSHGFYAMTQDQGRILISDLRMGAEPRYYFSFDLGQPDQAGLIEPDTLSVRVGLQQDPKVLFPWIWRRMLGQTTEPLPSS
jgi:inner membrane protein